MNPIINRDFKKIEFSLPENCVTIALLSCASKSRETRLTPQRYHKIGKQKKKVRQIGVFTTFLTQINTTTVDNRRLLPPLKASVV